MHNKIIIMQADLSSIYGKSYTTPKQYDGFAYAISENKLIYLIKVCSITLLLPIEYFNTELDVK